LLTRARQWFASLFAITPAERKAAARDYRDKYGRENSDLKFIRAHLTHGLTDVIASLIGVAVPINSAILVIAATVFFRNKMPTPAGLFDAYDLVKEHIGKAAAFMFALALLCAGQTASITATLAGQVVSEGFIEWRISPFLRRLITRMIGLIPSMVVAIAVGRDGIDTLLVASQVVLSIVLPFVAFPLIWLTSSKSIMRVRKPVETVPTPDIKEPLPSPLAEPIAPLAVVEHPLTIQEIPIYPCYDDDSQQSEKTEKSDEKQEMTSDVVILEVEPVDDEDDEYIDFSNGWIMTTLVSIIFMIVLAANFYVIVMLSLGKK